MRLTVDLSEAGIVLPRGVWWVNAHSGCGSIGVNIAAPIYMGHATADTEGNAVFARFVPEAARGRTILFQALQRTTCLTSNVVEQTFE